MSSLNPAILSARGCTTFGCIGPLPDFSGRSSASAELVTGAARYPLADRFSETVGQPSDVILLSAETPTPFAAFCVPSGSHRFYFVFNPLDPACRQLMHRSTQESELQMLLWDNESQQLGFGLQGEPFAEVLRVTHGRKASDLDEWIAHVLSVSPELPDAFASQIPGIDDEGSRHCAVLMVTRDRLDHVIRTYSSMETVQ